MPRGADDHVSTSSTTKAENRIIGNTMPKSRNHEIPRSQIPSSLCLNALERERFRKPSREREWKYDSKEMS